MKTSAKRNGSTVGAVVAAAPLLMAAVCNARATCYVNASATGHNNGTSWADAYTVLGFALVDSTCNEIRVAKGVYQPTLGTDQTVSFVVTPGMKLIGGFASDGSGNRDVAANITVLSGDIDNNDANTATTNIDTTADDIVGKNTFHIVSMDGRSTPVNASTVLDGFVITGGDARVGDSSIALLGGGGLNCNGSSALGACSPTLINLTFSGNAAAYGGAIFNNAGSGSSSPTITHSLFSGNHATDFGGAIENYAYSGDSKLVLSDVEFVGNSAGYEGGAVANECVGGTCSSTLMAATFRGNHAGLQGGAVATSASLNAIANSSFTNVTFYNNDAAQGGAFANVSIFDAIAIPTFTNVTFTLNRAAKGGAVYSAGHTPNEVPPALSGTSAPRFYNSILWADRATSEGNEVYNDTDGNSSIDYSLVANGCPSGTTCPHPPLDLDPQLASITGNGGFTKTLMPNSTSPAIDSANAAICPAADQRQIGRPQGAGCDLGAVERRSEEDVIFKDSFDVM